MTKFQKKKCLEAAEQKTSKLLVVVCCCKTVVDRAMESRGAMKKNEAGNEINFCLQSHIPMLYFVSMKLPVFGLTDTPTSG